MNPEKMIWSSVSGVRRNSTYISLEYVLNDIGIFCKGEQRSKSLEFVSSPMGEPMGLTVVEGTDYAAKPLGKAIITWDNITDVSTDDDRSCIIVKGKNDQTVVLQYDSLGKEPVFSFIEYMTSKEYLCPDSEEWYRWAADQNAENIFAPLEEQIENHRIKISENSDGSDSKTDSSFSMLCPACNFVIKHEEAKYCSNCGRKL